MLDSGFGCGWAKANVVHTKIKNKKQMHLFCFCRRDSQNGFAEKVRWGKNLNIRVGLSVGIFYFQSVCLVKLQ